MLKEPLRAIEAERLIRKIIVEGNYVLSKHAKEELAKDDLDQVDCVNVLRSGWCGEPELVNDSWRYRVSTDRMCVVVAFRSESELIVVTAWRCSS